MALESVLVYWRRWWKLTVCELFFGYLLFPGRTVRTRVRKGHTCYAFRTSE